MADGLVQAVATAALAVLGDNRGWLRLLLTATFVGVGFIVTTTSGLSDAEQGMANGVATMSQQVGITMGTPVVGAVVTAHAGTSADRNVILDGISTAVLLDAALVLPAALFLRPRPPV
ncbi:hypothetical protein OG552_09235 [Streptomyces sp. NBC_01476]|uniref:hypothetical protein n=1 Tax=Streptomyces sp. NBC_01476 TaxID=2903881 RepID=UPI002E376FD5|nr:hypothetical protein [Streptomyces sp. NBC_01476]